MEVGKLDRCRGIAITKAAGEIIEGKFHDQFVVDVFQAGAGTSHNMNANEVIANRAIEILGGKRGDYSVIHPNDHSHLKKLTGLKLSGARIGYPVIAPNIAELKGVLSRKKQFFPRILSVLK